MPATTPTELEVLGHRRVRVNTRLEPPVASFDVHGGGAVGVRAPVPALIACLVEVQLNGSDLLWIGLRKAVEHYHRCLVVVRQPARHCELLVPTPPAARPHVLRPLHVAVRRRGHSHRVRSLVATRRVGGLPLWPAAPGAGVLVISDASKCETHPTSLDESISETPAESSLLRTASTSSVTSNSTIPTEPQIRTLTVGTSSMISYDPMFGSVLRKAW
eukprot:3940791-Rhodomonas_salina.3